MHLDQLDDKSLVKSYLDGKERALGVLVTRHKSRVYTAIYMFVKDSYLAEDLFQDTFIKVVDRLRRGKYKEEGKFLPWVLRIANNLCIDYYRKTKRKPSIINPEGFDIFEVLNFEEDNAQDEIIKRERATYVKGLLDQLSAEQKEVVILRHYADLSFKQISELTGVSINTSLGRMRYALINMRKMIEQKETVVHPS